MKELLDKLSSYNVLNYLFPGILAAVFVSQVTSFHLLSDNAFAAPFLYYFYGLVVSRIGSLVLEPLLKRLGLVRFVPYAAYAAATRLDPMIETLSEQNNTYRTLASLIACVTVAVLVDRALTHFASLTATATCLGVFLLFVVMILSYRKQAKFVAARVATAVVPKAAGQTPPGDR